HRRPAHRSLARRRGRAQGAHRGRARRGPGPQPRPHHRSPGRGGARLPGLAADVAARVDLAHVGNYEELWLLRAAAGREAMRPEIDGLYDAFEHPRAERPSLPLLPPAEARSYIGTVRAEVLDSLASVRFDTPDPLTSGGFVYGMVVQHEHMHDETMLA